MAIRIKDGSAVRRFIGRKRNRNVFSNDNIGQRIEPLPRAWLWAGKLGFRCTALLYFDEPVYGFEPNSPEQTRK
jgi:hypothetical protein